MSEPTVRRYLDTLTQTLMVRQLLPWHENLERGIEAVPLWGLLPPA